MRWLCATQSLAEDGEIYNRLANSIAPEIWGHEDVKKVRSFACWKHGRHAAAYVGAWWTDRQG
jgi:MCM P-loop domain